MLHSRVIVEELSRRGATLLAFDPVAMPEARRTMGAIPNLHFVKDQVAALEGSDALVIVTEWRQFKSPDFDGIKSRLKQPLIFDGRNLYDPAFMRSMGFDYLGIGRNGAPSAKG